MSSPFQSGRTTESHGRVCIIIPSVDLGVIERFYNGLITAKGNPDTTYSEFKSIVRASEVCEELKLDSYVIYNDATGAVKRANIPQVQWLPEGEFNPASSFLDRVLKRASYLRRSSRKVTHRMPLTLAQQEAFDLFQTEGKRFLLTQSSIWGKIQEI